MLVKDLFEMSRADFAGMRSVASRIFAEYGVTVRFVPHFLDRAITRDATVSIQDVTQALQKFKRKKHQQILIAKERGMIGDIVLKDLSTNTNIVFQINFQNNEFVFKTVMRKQPDQFVVSGKLGGSEVVVEGLDGESALISTQTGVKQRGKTGHKRWSGVQKSMKRMQGYLDFADKAEAT
jgi:hypothetical protein